MKHDRAVGRGLRDRTSRRGSRGVIRNLLALGCICVSLEARASETAALTCRDSDTNVTQNWFLNFTTRQVADSNVPNQSVATMRIANQIAIWHIDYPSGACTYRLDRHSYRLSENCVTLKGKAITLLCYANEASNEPQVQSDPDVVLWQSINQNKPAELKAYLDAFPNGHFAALAKAKLAIATGPDTGPQSQPSGQPLPNGGDNAATARSPSASSPPAADTASELGAKPNSFESKRMWAKTTLYLHSAPDANSSRLHTYHEGDEVKVEGTAVGGKWYHADSGDVEGFVIATELLPEKPATESQKTTDGYWYYCYNPSGYYPTGRSCSVAWQRVPPREASRANATTASTSLPIYDQRAVLTADVDWHSCQIPDHGPNLCMENLMRRSGASEQALAIARSVNFDGYLSSFKHIGAVDIGDITYPLWANDNDEQVFLNGKPAIVHTSDGFDKVDYAHNPIFLAIVRANPGANLSDNPPTFVRVDRQSSGTLTLVYGFAIKTCHACDLLGTVQVGYRFDADGTYLGPRLVGVVRG